MFNARFATLGLACLFASACTVVLQPAANQPRTAPSATEQDADAGTIDPQPVSRPTVQAPRRRTEEPTPPATEQDADVGLVDPQPVNRPPVRAPRRLPAGSDPSGYQPESPAGRPTARENRTILRIPPGHLPGPGECRVWVEGTPPGLQARARSCQGILATALAGSWILYRPAQYQRQVRVRYLHETRQMIVAVRAFDAETGAYLRDFALEEDDNNMGPLAGVGDRPSVRGNGRPNEDRGNSENTRGRSGTDREKGTNVDNNGVAAGRTDSTKVKSTAEPATNGGRRINRGTIGVAARPVDSTNNAHPTNRENTGMPVRPSEPEDSSLDLHVPSTLGIRTRYLPNPGQCRIWIPGLPFGRQARPTSCNGIAAEAPAGAWILRRSTAQPDVIQVDFIDDEVAGVVVREGSYNAATGDTMRPTTKKPR